MSLTVTKNESSFEPEVGMSYLLDYGNSNSRRIHVRAVVDGDRYVIRTWSPRKGWRYEVESLYFFQINERRLKYRRKSNG